MAEIADALALIGFSVERSKCKEDKVRIPVLFGECGVERLAFEADAFNKKTRTVIEVEAGRAVTNYQFLKDFFEACMMQDVDYLVLAVRQKYRENKDFDKVCDFFDVMFLSEKLQIPLKGILVIGY